MILIDFDGVLADFEGTLKKKYNDIIYTYGLKVPKWEHKLEQYNFYEVGLDRYVLDSALKEFCTFDMKPNTKMIPFIKRLMDEGIEFRIVTARTSKHSETIMYLEKWFNIPREIIWFIPEKKFVLNKFDFIIEDNPSIEGKNVYLIAHKYNEKVDQHKIAMRGTTNQITKEILEQISDKKEQRRLI